MFVTGEKRKKKEREKEIFPLIPGTNTYNGSYCSDKRITWVLRDGYHGFELETHLRTRMSTGSKETLPMEEWQEPTFKGLKVGTDAQRTAGEVNEIILGGNRGPRGGVWPLILTTSFFLILLDVSEFHSRRIT